MQYFTASIRQVFVNYLSKITLVLCLLTLVNSSAFPQIEVDQNNDVNLRAGEAIITDQEIDLQSSNLLLRDGQVAIKPNNGILNNHGQDFVVDGSSYFGVGSKGFN
jgi:hypothetical protein